MAETPSKPAELQPGRELAIWMVAIIALGAIPWLTGFPERALSEAIEVGSAQAERRGIGEIRDDQIRKAVKSQQDTEPFWMTLWLLGDFVLEPLAIAVRALAVATTFSAVAALAGRTIGFEQAFDDCAHAQRFWAYGLAVRVALMLVLKRHDVDTSFALLLPQGTIPALTWLLARQLEVFAILGWLSMAYGGWKRRQVNLVVAMSICASFAVFEALTRVSFEASIGAVIRLKYMPE